MDAETHPHDPPGGRDPRAGGGDEQAGLTSAEAARRLAESGPNEVASADERPLRRMLLHFWSPVPWMLEATIILQLAAGERLEAAMVGVLLLTNVLVGIIQEGRANATLALLRQRLAPRTRLRRDGAWSDAPASELVPGDVVQLSLGGIVPADVRLLSGSVLLDQSMLTGESVAVEQQRGAVAYAGALVRRGEAIAEVTATGARTYFGRTAELVKAADVESSEQQAVLGVVKALTGVNMAIVIAMVAYAHHIGMTVTQIVPLVLAALLSAVPVAALKVTAPPLADVVSTVSVTGSFSVSAVFTVPVTTAVLAFGLPAVVVMVGAVFFATTLTCMVWAKVAPWPSLTVTVTVSVVSGLVAPSAAAIWRAAAVGV